MKTNVKHWIILIVTAALALAVQSCRTEGEETLWVTLTATTEQDGGSRTYMDPDGTAGVLWSENDQIAIFVDGNSKADIFNLEEGAGTSRGVFRGGASGVSYYAFYPLSMIPSMSGEDIRITLPSRQTYTSGTFASGSYPMAARTTTDDLQFRNLCSIFRLSLTGYHPVTRIVFRSKDPSVKVCGKATVTFDEADAPLLTLQDSAVDSLVLTVDDVTLDEKTPTYFYMVLPSQTYKDGFSVRVYTGKRYMDKEYYSDFTMVRGRIHKAKAFEFEPNGLDESTALDGNGTANDPFLIKSLPDLIYMRDAVRGGRRVSSTGGIAKDAASSCYKLVCDIDLSPVCSEESRNSWKPIGSQEYPFSGSFDGGRHIVENLYINAPSASYQGLFGLMEGSVSVQNLSVSGSVTGSSYCGLIAGGPGGDYDACLSFGRVYCRNGNYVGGIAGRARFVSTCISDAEIGGSNYVGGITGEAETISDCVNKGEVSGSSYAGGIVGYIQSGLANCINYGEVEGGSYTGGICGYQNYGYLANSINDGPVSGVDNVGGIAGYIIQYTKLVNSVNHAGVTGSSDNVGGLCGYVSSRYSYSYATSILNSVNCGTVSSPSGSTGGICGYNAGGTDSWSPSHIEHNYWLWDSGKQLGIETGIGKNEGEDVNNVSLTDSGMKKTDVTDDLSGWAYTNISIVSNQYRLQGWKALPVTGYPTLTGFDAVQPGSGLSVLKANPSSFDMNALGGEIELELLSSLDYSYASSGWIKDAGVRTNEAKPYARFHSFVVEENGSEAAREGYITFTNTAGNTLKVRVSEKGRYLKLDTQGIMLPDIGGSKTVGVLSSIGWLVSSSEKWCLVAPASGKGDGELTISAAANDSEKARAAFVTLYSEDGKFATTLNVVQSGKPSGEQIDWTQYPFVHKSLGMRFTATWCGWCPRMNKSFHRAMELYPDKIVYIAIHGSGSDLQFQYGNNLANRYGIGGYPIGIVDGRVTIGNYAVEKAADMIVSAVKETESNYPTVTGVSVASSVSGRKVSADIDVYVKEKGDYKLSVILVEDGVICWQEDDEEGYHERYTHDSVARIAMSAYDGDAFSITENGSLKQFSYSSEVSSSYKLDNMRLVVYVQRYNASLGNYIVDNSAAVKVGDVLKLALVGAEGGGSGDGNEGVAPGNEIIME